MVQSERDFSVKKEVEIILKENGFSLDSEEVFDDVENDELMMDMISLSIYETILEKLKEKNADAKKIEEAEDQIAKIRHTLVKGLMDRNII